MQVQDKEERQTEKSRSQNTQRIALAADQF
jgi:hypothetical protein